MMLRLGLCAGLVQGAILSGAIDSAIAGEVGSKIASADLEPPAWMRGEVPAEGRVCAVGIAGRTHQMAAEKAKTLSRERAVKNLAGVFETLVEESEIDEATERGTTIEFERIAIVRDELVALVSDAAELTYWKDEAAKGPYAERGYTYAHACVAASTLKPGNTAAPSFDPTKVAQAASAARLTSDTRPPWLTWVGSQKGARFCAVGYSLPTLHPEEAFENVVEDVRGQLVKSSNTLVMSLAEELSTCRGGSGDTKCEETIRAVTAATSEAISSGVVVAHFWFDKKGIGPNARGRTTYGWGCAYPVAAIEAAITQVEKVVPEETTPGDGPSAQERVRNRASEIFAELAREQTRSTPEITP